MVYQTINWPSCVECCSSMLLRGKKATCRDLWSWNGIIYDWSVDILLCKSLYHIASSARGQDEVNPVFWLATWAGMMGPPSPARDSPYWSHARKLTKFVTFGQCRKKINDPLGFIVLQTQLAFTIGSRNKQAILDSYQSEIFFYTMNPLMIKPREYKLSWPSLLGQDNGILASFVSVHGNGKKKKELGQCPAILTSRLVNNGYVYILCRPIQIWQGKTIQKMYFWARNLSNV